jgi:hypothetical protein
MSDEECVDATVIVPCLEIGSKAYRPIPEGLEPGRIYTYDEIVALLGVAPEDNK